MSEDRHPESDSRIQSDSDIERWETLDSKTLYRDRWVKFRVEKCRTPRGALVDAYHIIDYPLWVNAVVITKSQDVLLLREYRHGVHKHLLGIPSGYVEASDASPQAAMDRELREETGYEASCWHEVSRVYANASNQTNKVVTYLALGAQRTSSVEREETEAISIALVPVQEFLMSISTYVLQMQALHVAAVFASISWLCADDDAVRKRIGLAVERDSRERS